MNFNEIDSCFGNDKRESAYDKLKAAYEKGDHSIDVLWRLAQVCHELSSVAPKAKRTAYVTEGLKYAEEGMKADPSNFKCVKWSAVLTGQNAEAQQTKQKIEMGNKFKALLDKAISMQPDDFVLLHLRGRYKFTVASLTWLEKKIAATFYTTVPTHTFEESIEDFQSCYKVEPKWIENLLYLAKAYIGAKDKENAKKYLKVAVYEIEPQSDVEVDFIAECKTILSKL
ncbi:unnamed protein product [Caenorhabditis angaria]|uniref:Regulator of microtubule dynamics protein 1 n=1 Tax=Caenorhabditis angaria TaxID=860376 RepID=A0A9P1IP92_9PELO|nr:unnamed protein product [Caenorhabditis angaria]